MNITTVAFFRIAFVEKLVADLLNFLVSIVGNYGIAIIATTIIVKLILFPISIKQEKSMARMKEIQPKVDAINAKYKGDKAKINEETAKLYKEEQVNPLAGCLPMLIQLPIFIALYWTFLGDSIPSNANFLWFNLKRPDALFTLSGFNFNLLPIISALLMFGQQKLMAPATSSTDGAANSMQNAMYFMPIFLLVLFYKFPSGVNLYYVVNTLLSILQQIYVIKKVRNVNE